MGRRGALRFLEVFDSRLLCSVFNPALFGMYAILNQSILMSEVSHAPTVLKNMAYFSRTWFIYVEIDLRPLELTFTQ